ncbi:hypothetical protein ACRQ5Q_14925 [Bradyrhizobium sp. PMVTL-01]|uniref:hypothetical protein n=1 Tax=Bradyrhizobium sp. PMVTL-01 TaxID=3434999 RepID=UPI003F701C0C
MRAIDQTEFFDPEKGTRGNCQQAATASLLGLELHEVPNFIKHPSGFWQSFWEFMASRGLEVIELSGERRFDCYHLAYGPSARGVSHAVVYRAGKLAHDPHPSRAGLLKVETTALVIPSDLSDWRGPAIASAKWGSHKPY